MGEITGKNTSGAANTPAANTPAANTPAANTLVGSAWRLVAFGPREALQPALAGSAITLTFTFDRIGGSAGCNSYFGGYTLVGGKLTIQGPASTRKMCLEPAGVMEQEYRYLQALSTARNCALQDGVLEIAYDNGASVCRYTVDERAQQDNAATAPMPM